MGLIREPKDVDFFVEDRPLTTEEKRLLKEAIAKNKATVLAERARKVRAKSKPKTRARVKAKAKVTR